MLPQVPPFPGYLRGNQPGGLVRVVVSRKVSGRSSNGDGTRLSCIRR